MQYPLEAGVGSPPKHFITVDMLSFYFYEAQTERFNNVVLQAKLPLFDFVNNVPHYLYHSPWFPLSSTVPNFTVKAQSTYGEQTIIFNLFNPTISTAVDKNGLFWKPTDFCDMVLNDP